MENIGWEGGDIMTIKSHNYAIEIEHILCEIFECDRFGFGGIVDADFIESGMIVGIASALATFYKNVDSSKKRAIDEYLNKYNFYRDKRIDAIIEEYGEVEMEAIINDFEKLLKYLR